ncbi:MAG: hypothetical protein LQ350_001215 [Teloschistes chrysophthalmus]|nr:MAG: hypothetical protein LQ350_001215 [Niorma chrysophthalma]
MSLKRKRETHTESTKENEQPQVNGIQDHPNGATESLTIPEAKETPTKRRRGRPPGSTNKPKPTPEGPRFQETPRSRQTVKRLFETPSKKSLTGTKKTDTPTRGNADRSAQRKSARVLVERTAAGEAQAESGEEDDLATRILDAEEEEEEEDESVAASSDQEAAADAAPPETPSKKGKKGPRRKRTPTPPHDLPPHEQYFFQNRTGNTKTSNNTFSSRSLLSHEQYYNQINAYKDPHSDSYDYLHSLHSRSFPQWRFELSQAFSICLYGYGSKLVEEFICSSEMGFRQLLKEFHDHQMIVSRRDATGAEMLGVPFRKEEIEAILEDLMA